MEEKYFICYEKGMIMFCQKCGKQNKDGAVFCNSCGSALNQVMGPPSERKDQEKIVERPVQTPVIIQQPEPEFLTHEPAVPQPKASTKSTSIKYIFFFIILCIIGGIILFIIFSGNVVSVSGTTWSATESDGSNYEYHFMNDGTLHYSTYYGNYEDAHWKQDGSTIYMEINNRYSERNGTIRGHVMEGNGWNVNGLRWTWSAIEK